MDKYDDVDKDYAKQRNKLIPVAEKFANKYCGVSCMGGNEADRLAWNSRWSKTFLRRMDHLYALTQQAPLCPTCGGKGTV